MFIIRTLQQRLIVFLVLPVAVFLVAIGVGGYFYIRNTLYQQWQQAAILRLQRAAHEMEMRLNAPQQWIKALAHTGGDRLDTSNQEFALKKLQEESGVSRVILKWEGESAPVEPGGMMCLGSMAPRVVKVSPVRYFYPSDHQTLGLRSDLLDAEGAPLGHLEVWLRTDYLMKGVLTAGWLQTYMACLLNDNGVFLAHTNPAMASRHVLGDTQNPAELAMLREIKQKTYATLMGRNQVIGYYRLKGTPLLIMLHAYENQIMAPILNFRLYYLVGGLFCLLVILLLIRLGVGPMVAAVRGISQKASQVARGEYGAPLEVRSQDEIGQLTRSFNDMVVGLKERDFISNTFGRYVDQEIAAQLLARPEAARLGGEKRQVVIMFSDIRDFTPLAQGLSPETTIHLVNSYFSRMVEVLRRHHGIIVDFLGDAILAFFDPMEGPMAPMAREALHCVLEMQQAMLEVNLADVAHQLPPLRMGIGLHAGEVVVGNIGSETRAKYGIVGAAVNLAHRLQAQAQGGEVVVSEMVFHHIEDMVAVKRTFQTMLKGIAHPVTLYVVESMRGEP
jgi:adenylate cyclase